MKVNAEKRSVQRYGVKDEGSFTIAATAQAFKILSDGLYSNKIRAIIRELSCNAHDAHVAAGHTKPFEIHMPSIIEPWFAVRDWGIGLSHDDIMHLYTTYFQSTKNDSNDFTGCLGLGSKSPFSYTDQFTVTAWFNGTKRLYSAFIGEAGNPQITLMHEEETDEPNGIEVKVTVKSDDFSRFSSETRDVLSRFNPKPNIVGADGIEIKTVEYSVTSIGWAMRKSKNHYDDSDPMAIQGNVAYPIDIDAMKGLTEDERQVLRLPIDIEFKLGELMVTASRETLSYGDKEPTTESIKLKCAEILQELPKQYQAEFDACKSLWEARIKFRELMNNAPRAIQNLARNGDQFKVTWRGEELKDSSFNLKIEDFCDPVTKIRMIELIHFQRRGRGWRNNGKARGYKLEASHNGTWRFEPYDTTIIFYDDIGRGAHSRIVNFMDTEQSGQKDGIYVIKTDHPQMLAKLKRELGDPEIRKVSSLPKPTRTAAVRKPGVKVHQYVGKHYDDRDCWKSTELSLDVGGIYVAMNRYKAVKNDDTMDNNDFKGLLESAKELGLFDWEATPVYGVYPRYAKKLADKSNWVSLWDYLVQQLNDLIKREDLVKVMAQQRACSNFNSLPSVFSRHNVAEEIDLATITAADSLFAVFVKSYREAHEAQDNDKADTVRKLSNKLNHKIDLDIAVINLDDMWAQINATYPILEMLGDSYHMRHLDVKSRVADYINLVDAAR